MCGRLATGLRTTRRTMTLIMTRTMKTRKRKKMKNKRSMTRRKMRMKRRTKMKINLLWLILHRWLNKKSTRGLFSLRSASICFKWVTLKRKSCKRTSSLRDVRKCAVKNLISNGGPSMTVILASFSQQKGKAHIRRVSRYSTVMVADQTSSFSYCKKYKLKWFLVTDSA